MGRDVRARTLALCGAAVLSAAAGIACAVILPVQATTQPGPLQVTDSSDEYAIQGLSTATSGRGVYGYAAGTTSTGQIGTEGAALGPGSYGVYGIATGSAGIGVEGYSTKGNGLIGLSAGTIAGVYGNNQAAGGVGIEGNALTTGIEGFSSSANAIVGKTTTSSTTAGVSYAGVLGQDGSTAGTHDGVAGTTVRGFGLYGYSSGAGYGLDAYSATGEAIFASTGASTTQPALATTGPGNIGLGELALSTGEGAELVGYAAASATTHPAVLVEDRNGGDLIGGFSSASKEVFEVDNAGDLTIGGHIKTAGGTYNVVRTADGSARETYEARESLPSVEDVGEAQLAAGTAYVRIDRAFASTMDPRSPYLVFITAQGATAGSLYVTEKSSAGFAVRENGNGRSSVSFDYRIVAKPVDMDAPRLPLAPDVHLPSAPAADPKAALQPELARSSAAGTNFGSFAPERAPAHPPLPTRRH